MTHELHAAMSWPVSVALFVVALLYLVGWARLRGMLSESIPSWRGVCFLLGLAVLWVALASPLSHLDQQLLTAHMLEHLLMMTVAPALLLLGEPGRALMRGLPRSVERVISLIVGKPAVQRTAHFIAQPIFCWLVAAVTLLVWHIPVVLTVALKSEAVHIFATISFFLAGLLFWWPVIRPAPSQGSAAEWSLLLYLFAATIPCDILSAFLVFSERVVYPVYVSVPRTFPLSALADQICAGALMWTAITILYLVPAAIITTRLLSGRTNHAVRVS